MRAVHFSTHSTNEPGTALRTIMTRRTRSSRSSSTAPARAVSMDAYRAHAWGIPEAEPRRIVVTSLNIPVHGIPAGFRTDVSDCTPAVSTSFPVDLEQHLVQAVI